VLGANVSVGIAQIKIETANDLTKKDFYNPNPDDKKLPFKRMSSDNRSYLYSYLVKPKHNISFAGAFIRHVIDFWSSHIDLNERLEIIATLYHIGYGIPKKNPESDKRV